jgi:nitrite reductase/ring-hydroxylating ferredoxin subunit
MAETLVSKSASLTEGNRIIVTVGKDEIGVFRHEGRLYAYSNVCLHSGGPACEGLVIAKVEERIRDDKTSAGFYFSDNDKHFVCPWHGYEYDLKTGEYVGDRKAKLRAFDVVEKDGGIYIRTN